MSLASLPAAKGRRRATFHTLTVAGVRELTPDSIEVTFEIPDHLAEAYSYAPGQYIAIRKEFDGEQVRRSYSICQAPTPDMPATSLKVGIKRDRGGVFSSWALTNLTPGMTLEVMSPEGKFVPRTAHQKAGRFVGVAAGSGITPMLALIEYTLQAHDDHVFHLIYSNRTTLEAMFLDELADLKDRYPTRLALHHVLTREQRGAELLSGRLDGERFHRIIHTLIGPGTVDEWFLCGPLALVETCRTALRDLTVADEDIRFELFSTDQPGRVQLSPEQLAALEEDDTESHEIKFRLDGNTSTTTSPVNSRESILSAALRIRGDVPFACAGGVCGSCRAKKLCGEVDMVENYALEPDELAAGYILTCQSIPLTDQVSVDYDA